MNTNRVFLAVLVCASLLPFTANAVDEYPEGKPASVRAKEKACVKQVEDLSIIVSKLESCTWALSSLTTVGKLGAQLGLSETAPSPSAEVCTLPGQPPSTKLKVCSGEVICVHKVGSSPVEFRYPVQCRTTNDKCEAKACIGDYVKLESEACDQAQEAEESAPADAKKSKTLS